MAQPTYLLPIESIHGAVDCNHRIIHRQKTYRLPDSDKVFYGKNEIYEARKRDYTAHPIAGNERSNHNRFARASAQMQQILSRPDSAEYQRYRTDWLQQLHADKPPVYRRFDRYILAKVLQSYPKVGQSASSPLT